MPNVLTGHGQIKSMRLPEGWREFDIPDQGFAPYSVREFRPSDSLDDRVSLCLYSRGLQLDSKAAARFSATLSQGQHPLTREELATLADLLDEAADPERFAVENACVSVCNGRQVLVLEGRWINSQTDMIRIYTDCRGDGKVVEELFFSAPKDEFAQHISRVMDCLSTIEWQERS